MPEPAPIILFVDDEATLLREFPEFLKWGSDLEVLTAGSLDDAFDRIRGADRIDLAILDFQLPTDGREPLPAFVKGDCRELGLVIAERLRADFPDVPIIFWSGSADQTLRARALRFPNAYSYPKSLNPKFIRGLVKEILSSPDRRPKRKAFIVHGHDEASLQELKEWLARELGIMEPIVLRDMRTGGETLIDKLENYALSAELVFVLLTPDDVVVPSRRKKSLKRARQNVIFELGYFFGRLGRKTGHVILLCKGDVELPSDLHGMITIDISQGIAGAGASIQREIDRFAY